MIYIRKNEVNYPFSRGILSRSIASTGLSLQESYDVVIKIKNKLEKKNKDIFELDELKKLISEELLKRGYAEAERYYRVRSNLKYLQKPIMIIIGGGTGVGKSTISAELAHRFGISRIIGTDFIREIMRYMLPKNLVPSLHTSSFLAGEKLKNKNLEDSLIFGFIEQTNIVLEGFKAVINRSTKEGLNLILNGIHILPGQFEASLKDKCYLFRYILDIPNTEEHQSRFYPRSEESNRQLNHYLGNLKKIRRIQDYITQLANEHDVPVIENQSFDDTLDTISDDIIKKLEKVIEKND
ncbi:MAG: 2-phosphoglycerate kinase [Candidatus Cloacimonetes bacterium]|nr:2-phosphoglycerate kinase [Candidatus Cloacimonadota bacterium]MBS3767363.1 2-phosphoglycerate kinase [Candidatus Cloacimonadota bacterium]